jgi:hypothetical protein
MFRIRLSHGRFGFVVISLDNQHEFDATADWYANLAQQPGWLEHCRHAVQELEADESGLYKGLRLAVRARIDQKKAEAKKLQGVPGEVQPE